MEVFLHRSTCPEHEATNVEKHMRVVISVAKDGKARKLNLDNVEIAMDLDCYCVVM